MSKKDDNSDYHKRKYAGGGAGAGVPSGRSKSARTHRKNIFFIPRFFLAAVSLEFEVTTPQFTLS
jgi:hypothetical protein